jgi:hypothetical protein
LDNIRAIKLIALKDVLMETSVEAQWRRVARWYSKTFATPLHLVDDLPRLDIIQSYFEEHYENLDEAELNRELQELLKPEDQLQKSLDKAKDDSSLDELVKQAESKVKAVKVIKAKRAPVKEPSKQDVSKEMLAAIADLGEALTSIKDTAEEPPDQSFGLDFSGLQDL